MWRPFKTVIKTLWLVFFSVYNVALYLNSLQYFFKESKYHLLLISTWCWNMLTQSTEGKKSPGHGQQTHRTCHPLWVGCSGPASTTACSRSWQDPATSHNRWRGLGQHRTQWTTWYMRYMWGRCVHTGCWIIQKSFHLCWKKNHIVMLVSFRLSNYYNMRNFSSISSELMKLYSSLF